MTSTPSSPPSLRGGDLRPSPAHLGAPPSRAANLLQPAQRTPRTYVPKAPRPAQPAYQPVEIPAPLFRKPRSGFKGEASVLKAVAFVFRKEGSLFKDAASLFRKERSLFRDAPFPFRDARFLFRDAPFLFRELRFLFREPGFLFREAGFGRAFRVLRDHFPANFSRPSRELPFTPALTSGSVKRRE